jgi:hypothetical protein
VKQEPRGVLDGVRERGDRGGDLAVPGLRPVASVTPKTTNASASTPVLRKLRLN